LNKGRYYGLFEIIRQGADRYYQKTNRNYFNDLVNIHDMLGLTIRHKNAILLFSLTPKKDYDATIIAESYNDDVTELLFSLLRSNYLWI
jgi:hypothetical protein